MSWSGRYRLFPLSLGPSPARGEGGRAWKSSRQHKTHSAITQRGRTCKVRKTFFHCCTPDKKDYPHDPHLYLDWILYCWIFSGTRAMDVSGRRRSIQTHHRRHLHGGKGGGDGYRVAAGRHHDLVAGDIKHRRKSRCHQSAGANHRAILFTHFPGSAERSSRDGPHDDEFFRQFSGSR